MFQFRVLLLLLVDFATMASGLVAAMYLRLGYDGLLDQLSSEYWLVKLGLPPSLLVTCFYAFDLYDLKITSDRREFNARLIEAIGYTWAILAFAFFVTHGALIGRGTALYTLGITLVGLLLERNLLYSVLALKQFGEKIAVLGDYDSAIEILNAVNERRASGYRVVGHINGINGNGNGHQTYSLPHFPHLRNLGSVDELESVVAREKLNRIVVGLRDGRGVFPAEALLKIRLSRNVTVEDSSSFIERVTGAVPVVNLRPSWLIYSVGNRDSSFKSFIRKWGNRLAALVGLVLSLPICLLVAVLIRLDSKGPILYRQKRVGKDGKIFELLKFRSMYEDAEDECGPVWAQENDERVTRVGRIIRVLRFDEIPQFWNILKGEMNFIGPRPERPEFVSKLSEAIPFYSYRHLIAPGLTGWAQINFQYGASIEDSLRKLQYDLYYIKNQSLRLDIIIFFETVKTILFGKGAR
jgi:sugar transferase (PEP-CTERM system associated)